MIPSRTKVVSALVVAALATAPLWAAVDPQIYLALTAHSGKGKHPASSQTGLILNESSSGSQFVCYGYTILTDRKIKGRLAVRAEVASSTGTRVLQSVSNVAVERLDLGQIPTENPCTGEQGPTTPLSLRYGRASECSIVQATLEEGDIVRWVFEFDDMPKLKGLGAIFQVSGQVIPDFFSLTLQEAEDVLWRQRVVPQLPVPRQK